MGSKVEDLETRLATETDLDARIDLLNDLAWELRDTEPVRSKELSELAFQLASPGTPGERPHLIGEMKSLRTIAHANRRVGNLTLSLSQSMQALSYFNTISQPQVEVDILRNIAIILGSQGNYPEGLEYAFKALNIAQTISDQERQAAVLGSIGVIYIHSKNLDESVRTFHKTLALNRSLGQARDEALTLNNLGIAYRDQGDLENALASSLKAMQLARETNYSFLIGCATGTVGEIYLAMGDYERSAKYFQDYLTAARANGSKRDETWAFILLGEMEHRRHQEETAQSYLNLATQIAQEVGLRLEETRCYELLADIYEQQGNLNLALAQIKKFFHLKETLFNDDTARRIAILQVLNQVETARRDTEIHYMKTIELQKEIEERKKIESILENLAAMDSMTGVYNRREIVSLAEKEFQKALQDHSPLSVIMIDVDRFKGVNDTYGHSVGDQLLITLTKTLVGLLRKNDFIGRFGGDEFLIVLPETNLAHSCQIAERLHEGIAHQSVQTQQGKLAFTVSLGVAELKPESDDRIDRLIDRADQALYSAKRAGRNRVAESQRE